MWSEQLPIGFGLFLQRQRVRPGCGGHEVKGDRFLRFAWNDSGHSYQSMVSASTVTQEDRWLNRYQDVMDFMEKNQRNPLKYVAAERGLRNWVKQQRKLKNKGELKAERAEMLERLLSLGEEYKHVNQWK